VGEEASDPDRSLPFSVISISESEPNHLVLILSRCSIAGQECHRRSKVSSTTTFLPSSPSPTSSCLSSPPSFSSFPQFPFIPSSQTFPGRSSSIFSQQNKNATVNNPATTACPEKYQIDVILSVRSPRSHLSPSFFFLLAHLLNPLSLFARFHSLSLPSQPPENPKTNFSLDFSV